MYGSPSGPAEPGTPGDFPRWTVPAVAAVVAAAVVVVNPRTSVSTAMFLVNRGTAEAELGSVGNDVNVSLELHRQDDHLVAVAERDTLPFTNVSLPGPEVGEPRIVDALTDQPVYGPPEQGSQTVLVEVNVGGDVRRSPESATLTRTFGGRVSIKVTEGGFEAASASSTALTPARLAAKGSVQPAR